MLSNNEKRCQIIMYTNLFEYFEIHTISNDKYDPDKSTQT